MFVCSRSFYLLLNEKVFFIQYKCCIDTRFSRCSSQEFAGFTVCEKFPSLLSIFIYPSIYFKILFFASDDVIVTRGTVTSQKPNLCLWGTWKFSPKNLRTEKIHRQIIFKSIKAFKRYVARFLKRCP